VPPRQPFEDVVAEHGATVLRVCRALLPPTDADDAWSETFLAALRAYPDLAPGANVEAWLVTIAKRKVVDQHRRRARRPVPVGDVPERGVAQTEEPDELEPVRSALARLTDRQRDAVVWHHLGGLPYAEVARQIGGSEAAVRRAAADGIRRLRAALRPRVDEEELT
jgi:RNA polymerase sigma factor (sigma-70 family)